MPQSRARWLALATLTVGALDILDPIIFYAFRGVAPIRILQSVAAGLIGRTAATSGGWPTALLGLALHFFIAFVVVLVYFLASRRLPLLTEHPIVCGVLYGLGVWVVMTYGVVPLSQARPMTWTPSTLANSLFAHVCLVGIPTAFFARAANRG